MNYYTSTIPVTLAEKLKEKGMPMTLWQIGNNTDYVEVIETRQEIFDESQTYEVGVRYNLPTYGACFDWLMSEKGVYIFGFRRFDNWIWEYATEWRFRIELEDISQEEVNGYIVKGGTWHEAANAAIEKALTLI